ncbi:MAG: hypothetical protein ACLQVY_18305 [Limisphaerales bacterium]
MMESRLSHELGALEKLLREARFCRELAIGWLAATGVGILFLVLQSFAAWNSPLVCLVPLLGGLLAGGVAWWRHRRRKGDERAVVAALEREYPELRHLLAAAAEQKPNPASGEFGYLQLRVIDEALQHPRRALWRLGLEEKLAAAKALNFVALGGMLVVLLALGYGARRARPVFGAWAMPGVSVTPGDTEVERGTSLVVAARFSGTPSAEATLVITGASGKSKRVPMERRLADPVFGASLDEVAEEGHYHVEYGGGKTPDFRISVFEYPSLSRADALLRYPDYTGQTNQTILDTRRVSAVEGTRLTYTLQFNKPVVRACWVGKQHSIPFSVKKDDAIGLLADFPLTNSARYALALEDAAGRTNKFPIEFVLQVLTNRRPELKLVFPRGDPRVSRLEELQLEGEAMDDFGLLKYGIGFGLAGEDPKLIELGQSVSGGQKRQLKYLIPLEDLKLGDDQVLAYFVWADDYGPDGKSRRTFSDIYFAEVRPFSETFRAEQAGADAQESQGQGQGQGDTGAQLAEMQKEIVIATWKLQQEKSMSATANP